MECTIVWYQMALILNLQTAFPYGLQLKVHYFDWMLYSKSHHP